MRMLGHAVHDGAEYVPAELLAEWEERDPIRLYDARLIAEGIADRAELDEIGQRCAGGGRRCGRLRRGQPVAGAGDRDGWRVRAVRRYGKPQTVGKR